MEKNKYKELIDNLPEIVFEIDTDGRITYINEAVHELLGYSAAELIGTSAYSLIDKNEKDRAVKKTSELLKGDSEVKVGEFLLCSKDKKKKIPSRISISKIIENSEIRGIRGVVVDISTRKSLEHELIKSENRLRRISDMALEGIVFYVDGKIIDANKAFTEMVGYSLDELIGTEIAGLVVPEYYEIISKYLKNKTPAPCEAKAIKKSNEVFDIEFTSNHYMQDGRKIFTVVVQDISHRKKVDYIREHDDLTELLNYRGFIKELKEQIDISVPREKKLAVMTIQIDEDKFNVIRDVNPDLEKIVMNSIPMEIAERLKKKLFKGDIIARTSDNEYMTIHPLPASCDTENSVKLINKVLNVFQEEFVSGVRLIAHVGVTFYPDDIKTNNPHKLIQYSRYACEEALFQENEYMFYDEKSHQETRDRIEFVKDLILAVKEDACENFMLYYQPKVNINGDIVGIEALIRWDHPRWNVSALGYVPPVKFIPTAEETGLISDIGNWVLLEACRQTKEWQDRYPGYKNLQVAVNVSPSQLNNSFIEYVDYVLDETGLDPGSLELEITERESIKDKNSKIIDSIRKRDISIAIDDFGIDYSSLSKLPKLDINTIKLDKSYIDNIATDSDYENLVFHTINMVHGFNYSVVAEGVEDEVQADKLFNEMNCDKCQGFFFYRPMTVDDFEKKLKETQDCHEE